MASPQMGHSRVSARFATYGHCMRALSWGRMAEGILRLVHGDATSADVDATTLLYSCTSCSDAGSLTMSGRGRLLRLFSALELDLLKTACSMGLTWPFCFAYLHSTAGMACVAWCRARGVTGATCEVDQRMHKGGC